MAVVGNYFATRAAKRTDGTLELHPDGSAVLVADGRREVFVARDIEVSRALGRLPRRFSLPGGAAFECEDDPSIDAWLELQGRQRFNHRLRFFENRWRWVIAAFVAFLAFVAVFGRFGIPVTARYVAHLMPEATRVAIGNQTENLIDPLLGGSFAGMGPMYRDIERYFGHLAGSSDVGLVMTLEFRDGGKLGANALALPNGKVVVTRQLVESTDEPLAVAGVIAHEIGHIHHRHGLQRAVQASMFPALLAWITGDLATSTTLLGALATSLVENSYSRGHEREADVFAAQLMEEEGLSTEPLAGLLEALLETRGDLPELLSTHPATWDRVAFFRGASTR